MLKPELLAPAGSFAALRAAVSAGADAVYLGGVKFSAREGAENFTLESLAEAVLFAHRSKVKVYVTVNTLLKDEEMEDALEFLRVVHNMGVDAVIVQDLGLADLSRRYLPNLALHASTQMTTTSLFGVKALKARGFARVVLARELSKLQIQEITEANVLPCEMFVHGALCVAYSGQCLFSSLVGARSGNRGQCAQPCRLPYAEEDERFGYPLSPKDLCLITHLGEVLSLNCSSLKIEGRLKRPEYVSEVVTAYRQAIDSLVTDGRQNTPLEVHHRLAQAFNRGFSTGYFHGKPGRALSSGDSPGHRGVVVGAVEESREGQAVVLLRIAVQAGDVLAIGRGEPFTLTEGYAENSRATWPIESRAGVRQEVCRLVDAGRNTQVMSMVAKFAPPAPRLDWHVAGRVGELLVVRAACLGTDVTVLGEAPLEKAKGEIVPIELLRRQLSKLGGTPYTMGEVVAETDPSVFLPLREINSCRRRAVEKMSQELWGNPCAVQPIPPDYILRERKRTAPPPLILASVANRHEAKAAEAAGAGALIFGKEWLECSLSDHLQAYRETKEQTAMPVYLRLPRILHSSEEQEWQGLIESGLEYYVSSLGAAELVFAQGAKVRGDVGLNVANSYTAQALRGFLSITASPELSQAELRRLTRQTDAEIEVVVHSRQLLMVIENSGHGSELIDRKGIRFPLARDYLGRSYVLNTHVLSHIDTLYSLLGMPISRLRLDIAGSGVKLIEQTVRLYSQALEMKSDPQRVRVLRGNVIEHWGILTRGHWQRGM